MNGHLSFQKTEPDEPSTYTKAILLRDDRSLAVRRAGSTDSDGTSEGTSVDTSPEAIPDALPTVAERVSKMNGEGLNIQGRSNGVEDVITPSSSPLSEVNGDGPAAQIVEVDSSNDPTPMPSDSFVGPLPSPMTNIGSTPVPASNGPPSPPPLIIPGTTSLPNSPDPNNLSSIQARRFTALTTQTAGNSPISPLSGRHGLSRPVIGAMPSMSNMRITPAVLLTPVVPRPLTLFPLPPVTPISANEEDPEQEARRARRNVPILMSPGTQEEQVDDGGSSPGTSDDEGDGTDSEGTSEEGTSTEGDARSTRSSSEGSSNIALSDSPEQAGLPPRERADSTATRSSYRTARTSRRTAKQRQSMLSMAAAMAPLTRPFRPTTSPDSDELPTVDGTPTPGPSKPSKMRERDYFTPKSGSSLADGSALQTPKPPTAGRPRGVTDAETRPRPSLYHQISRSLIDLSVEIRKPLIPDPVPIPQPIPENDVLMASPVAALKRRTSLPSVNPPAYSPPHPHNAVVRISAREEEGMEKLPAYSCGVHIEGVLLRKMEFAAPGVQARDRSWKKYWFELHGSSLKVFRHDLRKIPVKGYQAWDGKGCAEAGKARHVHLPEGVLEDKDRAIQLEREKSKFEAARKARRASINSVTSDTRRISTASALSQTTRPSSRASTVPTSLYSRTASTVLSTNLSSTPPSPNGPIQSSPVSSSPERPGPSPFEKLSPPPTAFAVPALRDKETKSAPSSANTSTLRHPHLPSFHHGNAMLRHYTMQGAESGLGADYKKRRNVIRVRAEGEQFLLQGETLVEVVNWIEAFQAATNIALDLDERPMPKLPTLPRRRRRRRLPQEGASGPDSAHPISPGTPVGSSTQASVPNSAASTSRS
ncbi:hypothetical protein DACRYDRAFT_99991 [Dacryopinax primogenitus]|uniref:PH domain-containing protein n=1 Tax=Dacryopinax primogenitus (strain DJM 731) TaxID=1858805 RepID=M5GDG3_DACPD|nr:uncharacterized protein DACRYDRAFT_99991 [Dacryopinax primogenitus]EJU02368.1 hypothetical protein DACRYDRAFT_99991 [Dacryopinax primogenitus]